MAIVPLNVEQEHLLSDHKYEDDSLASSTLEFEQSLHPAKKDTRRWRPLLFILLLVAIGVLLVFGVAPWYSNISEQSMIAQETSREDFVLDPKWDFNAAPQRREYDWYISDVEMNADGVYRPMMVINEQFPGPMIECNEGDTLVVHVHNGAANATSIHWHGMYQNGTNWMDGTVGITQCPIAPGANFTYEFSTSGQHGTYWYHGHRAVQASDGLLGPLIIHAKEEKETQRLAYDTDRVIMVQDHYYNTSSELIMDYLKNDMENAEPVPDSALINGRNVRDCSGLPDRKCDSSTASLPTLALEPGKTHRLRFINVGAFAEFQVQLDEHEFAITEVDGTDVAPAYFHRLNILPAQRYSMIVTANVTTQSSYWLRARMITHCFAEENEEQEPEARAIVQYSKTADTPERPQSKDWPEVVEVTCRDMNTSELVPLNTPPVPETADTLIYLRSNFEIGNWKLSRGFFNASTWTVPSNISTLSSFTSGIAAGNASFTSSLDTPFGINPTSFDPLHTYTYQTTGIRTLDVLVRNFDDGTHPLHLHGHKFWQLASGDGAPPTDFYAPGVLDLSHPLYRDTASVGAYDWVLLRFVADNPGMWAFHCHITWHAEAGLMMQFLTRADVVADRTIPSEVEELCAMDGVDKGERPRDEYWYGTPREQEVAMG